jgi:hypothetical protein
MKKKRKPAKKFYMSIGSSSYQIGPARLRNCLQLAREKYQNEEVNAIYAVQKGNVTIMKNEVYPNIMRLAEAERSYEKEGFKVLAHKVL